MKKTTIYILSVLIIVMSFSLTAFGKDDYETPIIPVTKTTSSVNTTNPVTGDNDPTTDPYETPVIPGTDNTGDNGTTDDSQTDNDDAGVIEKIIDFIVNLFGKIVSFFKGLFS